jgi:hypothetical protein
MRTAGRGVGVGEGSGAEVNVGSGVKAAVEDVTGVKGAGVGVFAEQAKSSTMQRRLGKRRGLNGNLCTAMAPAL